MNLEIPPLVADKISPRAIELLERVGYLFVLQTNLI
jgi:hypothetical protein